MSDMKIKSFLQRDCHSVPADEFDFDFVGGHNVYSFDDSCDNGIRVFSNMEVGGGQLEIRICSFLLAGSKLVDLLLQAVDFLACVLQLSSRKDASHSRDRTSRRSNSCRASASFFCNSSSSVVPPCKSCRMPLICIATSSV